MKKFYLILAALVAAISVNATIYATGDFAASKWDPANPVEFTETSDGVWEKKIEGVRELKISTVKGSAGDNAWNEFNGGALHASDIQDGVAAALSKGDGNIALPNKGTWTIVVNLNDNTLTATEDRSVPVPEVVLIYMIHGQIEDGGTQWKDVALTEGSDGKWSVKGSFKVGQFGIRALNKDDLSDQQGWWGGDTKVIGSGAADIATENGNLKLTKDGTYTFIFDPETATLEVVAPVTAIDAIEVEAAANVDVVTILGVVVRHNVPAAEATQDLPAGLYIVGGQKVLVK